MIFNTIIKGKGGITGEPIDVAELPAPSANTVGKVYAVDAKVNPEVGQVVGDKLYFDTSKNPLDYPLGSAIVMGATESGIHCTYVDFFELQGITGMGHCYAIGVASEDMSVFLGMPYVYCDLLTVAQFNANVGASLGLPAISAFGWQTDVVDITSIQDRKITYVDEEYDFVKIKGKDYYIGITDNSFRMNEPVGDKIYFDTSKNPTDYVSYMDKCLIGISNGTNTYFLSMVDVLAAQGVTGYGHCYALAISTQDMSTILGIAYIYCDVLNVAQFNQMIGSQFGVSITEFGWQTNVLDISAVADYKITYNYLADWDFLAYGNVWYGFENTNIDEINKINKLTDENASLEAQVSTLTTENATLLRYEGNRASEGSVGYLGNSTNPYFYITTYASAGNTTITIHEKCEIIGDYAFSARNIVSVVISDSVKEIGYMAFSSCYNLEKVTIGSGVAKIGTGAFYNAQANSLSRTFICKATIPPQLSSTTSLDRTERVSAIYVPAESVEAYKSATNWSTYADKIQAITVTVTVNYTVDGYDHGVMGDTAPETVAYGSNFAFQVDCEQGYAVDTSSITVTGATLAYTQTVYEPDGVTVVPESLLLYFYDVTGDVTINMTLKQY